MTFAPVTDRMLGPLALSPLRLAIAQARMTPTPAFESLESIGKLAERLPGWKLHSRHISRETQVLVNDQGVHESTGAPETVAVLRATDEHGMRAAISASSVSVECDRYTAWPRMHAAITAVLTACEPFIAGTCERFGVRYVNEISDDERLDGDPTRLSELLTPALVATTAALDRPVLGSMQELRTREEPGEFAVRHGLVRQGTYLLDLDRYVAESRPFASGDLAALADTFHRRIENVFVWTLNPEYLAELEGGEESNA